MKKIAFFLVALVVSAEIGVHAGNHIGVRTIDAGIGVGTYDKDGSSGFSFTQRLGIEWDVARLNKRLSLAAGVFLNNSYGNSLSSISWREGGRIDEADIETTRDDISFLPTVSLRYNCTSNLEAFVGFGLGLGILTSKGTIEYMNEDEDDYSSQTNASFAMSSYVGLRYFLTQNWAINGEFGMIAGNLKSHASSFNLFSVGASYRF
ncbi:MAG: outer membrane beta-barrel protein [bacterium]|nr:outer membrane beta-barrel protein [bacterium]